ncbi:hypothetical protein CFBP4996_19695 [Agrobacterium leguminum]|uniref:Uncharacterized protein n=1 Tax=Agrobacterium deltaense NCPPB 1641 TaxID=1183425 RepID=A0A1S7TW37_9HYPH|nr:MULTISPECIES: hypothetical protein [Agrobacterium]WFS68240.1 hypothetical protein CFBP4996_19695 [Agrobacterium leguminum]CVI58784.1 conserved hypothetical protein [Agrobacterium deltaense NCPPB 1641]
MTEQSLDDIMSGRGVSASSDTQTETNAANAATTAAPPSGQTTEQGQQRDGQGRFAGKEQTPAPGQAENAATQQPGQVPIQALDAERGKRKETEERYEKKLKELEDRIVSLSQPQQLAQPQPKPTLFDNPDGYMQEQLTPVQTAILDMKEFVSESMAVQSHGREKVDAAKAAIEQVAATPDGQRVIAEMINSQHPFEVLMNWHKRQMAFAEVGDDPEAWFQKRLAAMQGGQQQPQAQPQQTHQPAAQAAPLPTDFSGAPSGGPRGGPEYGGPRSLTDIMKR